MLNLKLKSFMNDCSGTIAVAFAVIVFVLLAATGVAIDYSNMTKERSRLNGYADAAVLAAATSGEEKKGKLRRIAKSVLEGHTSENLRLKVELIEAPEKSIRVTVRSNYKPRLMGMFGHKKFNIAGFAESPLASGAKLNLALVLDTTGSMAGTRMTTLKSASADLISELQKSSKEYGDVKASLVPFSDYVRIDTANRTQSWINVQPDREATWSSLDYDNSVNCRTEGSGETAHTVCDSYVYKEKTGTVKWVGCMASRKNGYHKNADYLGQKLQGPAGSINCNGSYNELIPLSANLSSLDTAIQNLNPIGRTYLPAGLIWGWRTLDKDLPFDEAKTSNTEDTRSVLLLMTDGSNTSSLSGEKPDFGGLYHWGRGDEAENQKIADALTQEHCRDIKAQEIEIITVAFEVTDSSTIDLLRNCASSSKDFYNATNSSALKKAFKNIGSGFSQARLSR